ncbi:MAG TPA: hypothetical protein VGO40_15640 [Longimicrobium sp.]|jgi:hypothetical protein|nr:hypothetical protein [Longimicrobium sp.]
MNACRTLILVPLALLATHTSAQSPSPASVLADTAAPPEALADAVLRACGGLFGTRARCVERALDGVLERSGVARAMAVLDLAVARDPGLTPQAHGIAHGLGIAAYRSPETTAEIFASCPNTQIAGCYHGVIQGYFLDAARRTGEVSAEDLNALCQPHRASPPLYFECTHGMGHGLMAAYGHRLPDVLARCDQLADPTARDSCWGGAFMENIVGALHPGHTAEAHAHVSGHAAIAEDHSTMDHSAHGGAMAGHAGMDHAAPARPWRALDRRDLLYPCTAVDAKYHQACYTIQTAAILAMNGGRVGHTARACSRAPREMVPVCHASLGRDLTAYARRDPRRTAGLCARAGSAETDCLRGAAYALFDVALRPADALALCRAVGRDAQKTACYEAVARRVKISTPEPRALAGVCAAAEPAYVAACRAAAGLPSEAGG